MQRRLVYLPDQNSNMRRTPLPTLLLVFLSIHGLMAQAPNVILGRPTDKTMTASLLAARDMDAVLEYGPASGRYDSTLANINMTAGKPSVVEIRNLSPNTRYHYRLRYRYPPLTAYASTPEYSFHTQRRQGSSFTFTVESDEHLYDKKGIRSMYQVVLDNQAADKPDFMLSLGDTFGDDHDPLNITSQELAQLHLDYRPFLGTVCHSIPFLFCLGNHEGENSYYLGINPPSNLAVQGTLWRKYYYPNPQPDGFYSGNAQQEPYGIGYPQNYYAWHWGDALFVVLDVYRYQGAGDPKPQEWDWSLGRAQYDWLKATLSGSTARYKFVFAHHIRGQGRGGVTNSKLYEWGGFNGDGKTYGFDVYRPGWGKPIHELFKDYGVSIFFQGHDHLFAQEVRDNIVYQAVPMAADSTYEIGVLANANAYLTNTVMGTGHIRVTVTPECTKVDFVRAWLPKDTAAGGRKNGETAFTYSVGPCSVTSVSNLSVEGSTGIRAYPNPAADWIRVEWKESAQVSDPRLYDLTGREVGRFVNKQMNVGHLPNGPYYIRYVNKGIPSSIPVQIQR